MRYDALYLDLSCLMCKVVDYPMGKELRRQLGRNLCWTRSQSGNDGEDNISVPAWNQSPVFQLHAIGIMIDLFKVISCL
jgi:hypothetical protein